MLVDAKTISSKITTLSRSKGYKLNYYNIARANPLASDWKCCIPRFRKFYAKF